MSETTLSHDQSQILLDPTVIGFLRDLSERPAGFSVPATMTQRDMTLYVRADGDDTRDGLTENTALATIQAAITLVAKFILHTIIIDIGPGNFVGFTVTNFLLARGQGSLLIRGTLGIPTTLTGATSGTASGGSTLQLVDSSAGWASNELRGKLLLVDGEYRRVRKNTSDTADLIGPLSGSCSGKDYEVLEHKTLLTSDNALAGIPARCYIAGNVCHRNNLTIQDIQASDGTLGFYNYVGHAVEYSRLAATGCAYGIGSQSTSGECTVSDCYVESATVYGYVFVEIGAQARIYRIHDYGSDFAIFMGGPGSIPSAPCEYWYSDNSTDVGMYFLFFSEVYLENVFCENAANTGICFTGCRHARIKDCTIKNNGAAGIWLITSQLTLENTNDISSNGTYGIKLGDREPRAGDVLAGFSSLDVFSGTTTIATNTTGGIHADYYSIVRLTDVDGTNTGAYGLELDNGSIAEITSATGITGATADATINGGASAIDWSTDFAANGDAVVNTDNGCRIKRKD